MRNVHQVYEKGTLVGISFLILSVNVFQSLQLGQKSSSVLGLIEYNNMAYTMPKQLTAFDPVSGTAAFRSFLSFFSAELFDPSLSIPH